MNRDQFQIWNREAQDAKGEWRMDVIHCKVEDLLAYKEVEPGLGYYLMVNNGIVHLGEYKGAVPHIGEAQFHMSGSWDLRKPNGEGLIKSAIRTVAGQAIYDALFAVESTAPVPA